MPNIMLAIEHMNSMYEACITDTKDYEELILLCAKIFGSCVIFYDEYGQWTYSIKKNKTKYNNIKQLDLLSLLVALKDVTSKELLTVILNYYIKKLGINHRLVNIIKHAMNVESKTKPDISEIKIPYTEQVDVILLQALTITKLVSLKTKITKTMLSNLGTVKVSLMKQLVYSEIEYPDKIIELEEYVSIFMLNQLNNVNNSYKLIG